MITIAYKVFDILHKKYGYCQCCGKTTCPDKVGSKLPEKIYLDIDWFWNELEKLNDKGVK